MRILVPPPDPEHQRRRRQELERLIAQPDARAARPCTNCRLPCPCSDSIRCTCNCSPDCPQIPRALSSDPDHHPLEAGIAPLVFALAALRVTPPCWSCEGHEDSAGRLVKPPRVWFTTRALFYPDIIAECLSRLRIEQRIAAPWQLLVVDWGARHDSTFSLEPQADSAGYAPLASLQSDARRIAECLPERVKSLAHDRLIQPTKA